jgi:hypothetical protein
LALFTRIHWYLPENHAVIFVKAFGLLQATGLSPDRNRSVMVFITAEPETNVKRLPGYRSSAS